MGGFFVLFIVGTILVLTLVSSAKQAKQVSSVDRLLTGGIAARGLLLQVSPTATRVTVGLRRFEQRDLSIDVEVPGSAPYEVNARPLIPVEMARNVLPGVTVRVRIDPKDPNNLVLVPPGGGLMGAPGTVGAVAGYAPASAAARTRTASAIGIVIVVTVGVLAFIGAVAGGSSSSHPKPKPASTSAPISTHTASAVAPAAPDPCKEAAQCCAVVNGRTSKACAAYTSARLTADACKVAYDSLKRAAAAKGKTCP